MRPGSRARNKSHRLYYDGQYAHPAPGTKNALKPGRMGSWSAETANPDAERALTRFPLRDISRRGTPRISQ